MSDFQRDPLLEDVLPGGKLARTAAISVVVAILAIGCAFALLRASNPVKIGAAKDAPQASSAIGMVEQTNIEEQRRGLAVRERDRESLDHYGWIDRDAGLARRPIEAAIVATVKMYNDGGER